MDYYLLQEHWSSLVRKFKDQHTEDTRAAEEVALFVLDYIRYTRFRQYNLFTQKRGEELERMITLAEQKGFSVELVRSLLEDDALWSTTLDFADQ